MYTVCTVIYRLYFHPLARFPGPKTAAATKWYEFYFDLVKSPGGTFMHEIERMHDVYGPVVRINPHEIHVKDSAWAEVLYASSARGIRDKYPPAAHMTGTPLGIFGTISHDTHRKRRAAISNFFSKSAVASNENVIHEKIERLGARLQQQLSENGSAEMRANFLAMTTDALCSHAFGRSMDLLGDEVRSRNWHQTIKAIAILTPLIKQFPWIIPVALKLPLVLLRMTVPRLARIVALRRDLYRQANSAIQSYRDSDYRSKSNFSAIPQTQPTLFDSILSSSLPPEEKSTSRIAQEGFVIVVAGGETTARVLTTATFHLLANRDTALLRLKGELALAMPDPDARIGTATLERLPWLTAVIKESLRITGLVTSRLPLVAPKQALRYADWVIPPGTPVSMTLRDILLDPSIFPEPLEFRPERWLAENPNLERISRGYLPFGRGSRMCIGLNLAMAELYIVIACLFRRFNLDLYDTTRVRDIDVVRDCFIGESSPQSVGVRVGWASDSC